MLPTEWNAIRIALVERLKRIAINTFLLFHILAITCWCIPVDSPLLANFRNLVRPYMLWSGLFQRWDMFAPSPRNINSYIEAVVIFNDGRTQSWKFPRLEQLSFARRRYKERYRKFSENIQNDANAALWPDVARYIARLHQRASDAPSIVILAQHWSEILPSSAGGSYRPEPWHAHIFFEYNVKPQDLQ